MNRFEKLFQNSATKAFIPYVTVGDPDLATSEKIIQALIDAGADALELGFPFSDPIADGPTNQRAMARALKAGAHFDACLALVARIREQHPNIPIGLLIYYNLLHRRGIEKAHAQLAEAGIDAIVSADLPLEESAAHEASLKKHGIGAVQMIAPNSDDDRVKALFEHSSAFTYVLSGFGTTGAKRDLGPKTLERIQHLRGLSNKPMVVGFGLSQPEHVVQVLQAGANGAIIGSQFTQLIEANLAAPAKAINAVGALVKSVKEAMKSC